MGDRVVKLLKQVATVMGAGGCFGMVLHAKSSMFAVPNTGNRVVIEIAVRDFQMIRQGLFFDGKTMVLGGDFNPSGSYIQNRLIGATMTKFQFIGLGSGSQ